MTNLNITLEVVHINYANRPTSDDEAFFVQNWTNCLGHNVRIRRIGEITREACMQHDMRNIYETYTRNVRYATYRSITPAAHVVLGHNKDDCLENIFTNILHQNKFDNLKGMSMYSVQDDISFLRPMLGISKKDIIQYARENSIPFLPNSTPSWSQRGQIRNTIVPCLDNWDSCFVPSMFTLSDVIAELYAMVTKQVNAFIKALVFENGCYQTKMCIETIPNSKVFWKCCFVALHIKVSARSLDNFMLKLQKYIDNPYAKELHVVMNKDTYLTMSSAKGEPIDISIATMIQYACSA
jgi:tRNA(Ile)-lysidine synthetase-like protein